MRISILALDHRVILAISLLEAVYQAGKVKELPGTKARPIEEVKAWDSGFTAAICALRSMGHPELAAELAARGEGLGVVLDEQAIKSYFEAGFP